MAYFRRGTVTSAGALRDILPENEHEPNVQDLVGGPMEDDGINTTDYADAHAAQSMTDEERAIIEATYGESALVVVDQEKDERNSLTDVPCLAPCCTGKFFAVFLCFYVLIQSMVVTGLFAVCIFLLFYWSSLSILCLCAFDTFSRFRIALFRRLHVASHVI
jgi:hypothetical protein